MVKAQSLLPLEQSTPIKIVVAGHVDDGKSTLIGRLMYETNSLLRGKYEEIEAISRKRNMPMEWSFLLDAFQAERDQAITIDTCQLKLKIAERDVLLIDAPGHVEFIQNMLSAAANANAAFLLIDAVYGIRQQTKRHSYLLSFLGIQQVVVLINKMDCADYSKHRFNELKTEAIACLQEVGIQPKAIIPIAARHGEGLIDFSNNMPWYRDETVLSMIHQFDGEESQISAPLRLPVQAIYKFDERRIIAGQIASGTLKVGDEILVSPSNQTAKIATIESWNTAPRYTANADESIGITLERQVFVERGDMISHLTNPPFLTNTFRAMIYVIGKTPLIVNQTYRIRLATRELHAVIQAIEWDRDIETLTKHASDHIQTHHCGHAILRTKEIIPIDDYNELKQTGRFIVLANDEIIAAGMASLTNFPNLRHSLTHDYLNLTKVEHYIVKQQRELRNGHKGCILWFTGLSGAGKSTLAMAVEQLLFSQAYQVYVLDGDNIRSGLNSNLGFSVSDRSENSRRVSEVAALFADAGFICIVAFISPYADDRKKARLIAGDCFHEVYIKADIISCEQRDPKGLYKQARANKIAEFTGVSAPYEAPQHAELIVDTVNHSIEKCVNLIAEYVRDIC